MPPISGKEGMVFCMNSSWTSVVNISSCQLAAGFLLSSSISSSFFPSSGGIVAVFSCGMATGSADGFSCGIADGEIDGFLVRIAAAFF